MMPTDTTLTLSGTLCSMGSLGPDDMAMITPDTPRITVQLEDGHVVHLLGLTRDHVSSMAPLFYEPVRIVLHSVATGRSMKQTVTSLTKADTVALWHAVQAQSDLFRATRDLHREDGQFTAEQIEGERLRLLHSKRALRKVNAIRKQQAMQVLQIENKPAGGAGP
ncbi:MAG: hypothetical protein RJB68_2499 [Pseudomonadota bacterium]|jgi:hypothetical protein